MPSPMMVRINADEQEARHQRNKRRLKIAAGIAMLIIGIIQFWICLLVTTAPTIYDDFAGTRSLPHLVLGLILVVCGGFLLYHNRE